MNIYARLVPRDIDITILQYVSNNLAVVVDGTYSYFFYNLIFNHNFYYYERQNVK